MWSVPRDFYMLVFLASASWEVTNVPRRNVMNFKRPSSPNAKLINRSSAFCSRFVSRELRQEIKIIRPIDLWFTTTESRTRTVLMDWTTTSLRQSIDGETPFFFSVLLVEGSCQNKCNLVDRSFLIAFLLRLRSLSTREQLNVFPVPGHEWKRWDVPRIVNRRKEISFQRGCSSQREVKVIDHSDSRQLLIKEDEKSRHWSCGFPLTSQSVERVEWLHFC